MNKKNNKLLKIISHEEYIAIYKAPEFSLQNSSPISWEHINFIGRYEFKKKHINFNLKKIAEKIMDSNKHKEGL